MPVQPCTVDGKPGRRWGEAGTCYPCAADDDCADAEAKAQRQGRAVEADSSLLSPGAAFARQARMEAKVEAALLWAMRGFLRDVISVTLADDVRTSPAAYAEAWAMHVNATALRERLPEAVALYVAEGLAQSTVPDEAYNSAMAVLSRAAEQQWSARERESALRAALALDSGETFLTAAAPVVQRDEAGRPIYRRTAKLDEGGMSWAARMRMEARTAVTGLDGIISTERMRQASVPQKRWVTRRDERVRVAHADADGQTVPVDQPFTVGGYPMMYPGDRSAPARLVVNCRCVTVAVTGDSP